MVTRLVLVILAMMPTGCSGPGAPGDCRLDGSCPSGHVCCAGGSVCEVLRREDTTYNDCLRACSTDADCIGGSTVSWCRASSQRGVNVCFPFDRCQDRAACERRALRCEAQQCDSGAQRCTGGSTDFPLCAPVFARW